MLRNKRSILSGIDVVAALTLFCVFAVSVLFVLASGAGVYRSTASLLDQRYTSRIQLAYVAAKARDSDGIGSVTTATIDGLSALIIREEYGNAVTLTYVYCLDGYIRELYADEGVAADLSLGEKIIECDSLVFTDMGGSMIKAVCGEDEIFITSRCGEIGDKR